MADNPHVKISFLGILIWSLGAVFLLYEFALRTFIGTIAPQIISSLHLTTELFSLLGTGYFLAYSAMQIPVGILGDKFGIKKILTFAILICAISAIFFSYTEHFASALIARVLMGIGSSFGFISVIILTITWFPKRCLAFMSGASQFISTLGPLLAGGPLIYYMSATHTTWRTTLFYLGEFGFLLGTAVLLIVKNKPRDEHQPIIFLEREIPFKTKIWKLFKNPQAWLIAIFSMCCYISISQLGTMWGTQFLEARGLTQGNAANIISCVWLGYALGCPIMGGLSDFFKRRKPFLIITCCMALITSIGIIYFSFISHLVIYYALYFMLGASGAGQNLGFVVMAEHVDTSTRATALGVNNTLIVLGSAILSPVVSLFIREHTHYISGYIAGFSILPFFSGLGVILAIFMIKETFCKPQKETIKLRRTNDEEGVTSTQSAS